VALAVPVLAVLVFLVVLSSLFLAMLSILRMMMRNIDFVVPSIFHEIDRVAAGVVFVAVLAPVLRMAGGHVHVDRLVSHADGRGPNHDGSCIDDLGMGKAPDVNAAVETGLGYADRHADIGCLC